MRKRFPFIRQPDAMDCGAACLSMVSRYYGKYHPVSALRERCHAMRDGVSMLGLSEAAEGLGMRTMGVRITFAQLVEEAVLPCIAHWKQNHFIVVHRIKARRRSDGGLCLFTRKEEKISIR